MAIDCKANSYRAVRWTIALFVLAGCVGGLLTSTFSICTVETVTAKGEETVTSTCDGPTVTDAGVVAVTLFIVLLLVPDMSEVGIFGVSLKRRLEAAETKAERLETQLMAQTQRVDLLSQNVATASAQGGNVYFLSGDSLGALDANLPNKMRLFLEGGKAGPLPIETLTSDQEPDPALVVKLLDNWEKIRSFDAILPPAELSRFRTVFDQELQVVQAARNTVAHSRTISTSDLQKAVDISEQLVNALRGTPWGH